VQGDRGEGRRRPEPCIPTTKGGLQGDARERGRERGNGGCERRGRGGGGCRHVLLLLLYCLLSLSGPSGCTWLPQGLVVVVVVVVFRAPNH